MSRVQLALNVADLDDAIAFYSKLFGTTPAKVRPGYANFAVTEPPLKLILIAGNGEGGKDVGKLGRVGFTQWSLDHRRAAVLGGGSGTGHQATSRTRIDIRGYIRDDRYIDSRQCTPERVEEP